MPRHCQLELLLGRHVVDAAGRRLGRIEEVVAIARGDECVIHSFHLGAAAGIERVLGSLGIPLPWSRHRRRLRGDVIPWEELDLSDPEHPRTRTVGSRARHKR